MTSPFDRATTERRCLLSAAALACVVALASPALAQSQIQLDFTWEAPPGCPQAAAVKKKLNAIAGAAFEHPERLHASGRITRVDNRYRLKLSVNEGEHERSRTIDADSCPDLAGAAAVALGLLLRETATAASSGTETTPGADTDSTRTNGDAAGATRAGENNPGSSTSTTKSPAAAATAAKPPEPKKQPEEPRAAESRSETESSSPRRWRVIVRAPLGTVDVGPLPKPSFGLGGGLGLKLDAWRVGVSGRMFLDQTLWSDTPNVGMRVSRAMFELWTCRGFGSDRWELAPCALLGLDHITARGTGLDVKAPTSTHDNSVVVGAALAGYVYATEWLAVLATAGLGFETTRPRFTIDLLGEVHQLGPLFFSIGLGPEWIF